jgi:superfamily II DNA or RNA helicase
MLRDLDLLPVYDSAEKDLIADLIVPLLANSVSYYRGVGFFTSGWLRVASKGVVRLVENGGVARIVLSPIMDERDWDAFCLGDRARREPHLRELLRRSIHELEVSLERDTLNCLAWLIADGVLHFRFAIPKATGTGGDYHDKVGVFTDQEGDTVAIHGSFNDTVQGTLNGEAFSVFKSWEPGQHPFAERHRARLTSLWEHGNAQFAVYGIPDAIRDQLARLRSSADRPYMLPAHSWGVVGHPVSLHCPITLYDFQLEAIEKWKQNRCHGLLEMATGTGKTVTALAAAVDRHRADGRLLLVVLVPYLHLLEQWARQCREFGFLPLLCSGEHRDWFVEARSRVADLRLGVSHCCLLVVHNTAASPVFTKLAREFPAEHTMLVADEVHALGAPIMRAALVPEANLRLGLSATPRRWFDDDGTKFLLEYFHGVCFEFPLEAAIGRYLVPYDYHPLLVELQEDEERTYEELTAQVGALQGRARDDPDAEETLKLLLIERARVVGGARNKVTALLGELHRMQGGTSGGGRDLRDILIYCAPGTHQGILMSVSSLGIRCHEFVHTVSLPLREDVLRHFAAGDIQALVAIKCLDEGVDVPSTRTAFLLASTTNPREFVQRRGRVLRFAEGKQKAVIHDFMVVPSSSSSCETGQSLLQREFPRFAEFASAANNEFRARSVVRTILDRYGMLHLMDERPWDVYHKVKGLL